MNIHLTYDIDAVKLGLDAAYQSDVLDRGLEALADSAVDLIRFFSPGGAKFKSLWQKTKEFGEDTHLKSIVVDNAWERQDIVAFMEYGTKAHPITARPGHVLRFLSPDFSGGGTPTGADFWYAKSVMHPGTKPYKMVEQAYMTLENQTEMWMETWGNAIQVEFDS